MDSYIIRIYRREGNEAGSMVGIVSDVSSEESRAFKTVGELWEVLKEKAAGQNGGAPCETRVRKAKRTMSAQAGQKAGPVRGGE
jgi:hypothetical protein